MCLGGVLEETADCDRRCVDFTEDLLGDLVEGPTIHGVSGHEVDDTPDLAGYTACSVCRQLILDEVARVTGGLCGEHWRLRLDPVKVIELGNRSARYPVYPGASRRQRRRKRSTKTRTANEGLAEKARRAAQRRMKDVFPEIYELFLGEERERLGLPPFPIERTLLMPDADATQETVEFAALYDRLLKETGQEI